MLRSACTLDGDVVPLYVNSRNSWTVETYSILLQASTVLLPEKRVITAPVVNRATCNANNMANPNRALANMMCAGLTAATGTVAQATCTGNTGGALYCNNEVVGILAFGMGCGTNNHPGVYMQTREFIAWMNTQTQRTDTIAAGTTYPR